MAMTTQTPETISRKDVIDVLVAEKFAVFIAFEDLVNHDGEIVHGRSDRGQAKYTEYIAETRTARRRYRANLNTLSRAELEEAFNKLPTRRLGEHDGKFLHEHFADAEYDYWARCSMWSLE